MNLIPVNMKLFDNGNIKFSYDEKNRLLHQQWIGFMRFDTYKSGLDELVKIVRSRQVNYIISDTRQQAIMTEDVVSYAASVVSMMIRRGLKKMAIILPASVFTELSIKKIQQETEKISPQTISVQYFIDEKEANDWIFESVTSN